MIESARFIDPVMIEAIIDGVTLNVPDDMGNRHRQDLSEWEKAGNVIEPYVAPKQEPVPPTLDERLSKLEAALVRKAILDPSDIAAEALPTERTK